MKQSENLEGVLEAAGIDPALKELFVSQTGKKFGTDAYFLEAMKAGFYGTDDRQLLAFRPKA